MARCSDAAPPGAYAFGVAAVRAVAALFVFIAFEAASARASASVAVEGLNGWLTLGAERSLNAVYEHIPNEEPVHVKEELLRVVANRLLLGYSVRAITFESGGIVRISLQMEGLPVDWGVSVAAPNLSAPVDSWFRSDTEGMSDEIASLMRGVPIEALSWGDIDLKETIERIGAERIPGWRVSLMVRNRADGQVALEVSFTPDQPLTLAVTSKINSSSIPVMLHSNLKDDIVKGFAPVIGIPVPWLDRHKDDLAALSKEILADEYLVKKAHAEPNVGVAVGSVSTLDIELESRRYSAWVWMSIYAGTRDRYPEAGLHFGRRVRIFPREDMEMYAELMVQMDSWNLETRLGMRWPVMRNLWLGGEWSSADGTWWGKAALDGRVRRPYAWLRYSGRDDVNAALGVRVNDFLSIELHYDSRFGDPWNVRALVNL
ncbi:MAG: hypothetical protein LBS75_04395 [Synergistaceae bacterium]|nr:hypothetical protein [Synergistaceae bacterium]